jgi:hypothetical protein
VPADGAGWTPGTTDMGEIPSARAESPVNGTAAPARDSRQAGTGDSAPAFGLTGRHRRFGSAPEPDSIPGTGPVPGRGFVPRPSMPEPGPALPALPAPPAASGWFGPSQTARDTELSNTPFDDTPFDDTAADDIAFRRAESGEATADGSRPGLPKRARGTNLAPQLRRKLSGAAAAAGREGGRPAWPRAAGAAGAAGAAEPPDRSPEEAGSLLSALQDGWERARIEDLDYWDGEDQR